MKRAALLFPLLLAACGDLGNQTLPDGVTAADVALFERAVTAQGCRIETRDQGDAIAQATGLPREKLRLIAQYLTLAGSSEPTTTGFRLTTGPCTNA